MRNRNTAPITLFAALAACAGHGPLRVATEPSARIDQPCGTLYKNVDDQIASIAGDYTLDFTARSQKLKDLEQRMKMDTSADQKECWTTSFESHADYDLLYAEFDDSGNATDLVAGKNVTYASSELHLMVRTCESQPTP
ncbi:MAG: hypothetical protein WA803_18350 [Steroidobacteraceae bacterium]